VTRRVPPLDRDEIDAGVADRIQESFPRAARFFADDAPPMPPVLGLLARHPTLAGPWLGFSGALLDSGVLDSRTRELLILATAHRTDNDYVWNEHLPMAAAAGVSPAEVEAIAGASRVDRKGADWSDAEAPLFRAVDELVECHRVSDATWASLGAHYDDEALLEVLFVVGAYSCLAMLLNSTGLNSTGLDVREESA
jgi:alkylhydroperoxidase family enzyme